MSYRRQHGPADPDRRGVGHQRDREAHPHGRAGRLLPRRATASGPSRGRPARPGTATASPSSRSATRTTGSRRCCWRRWPTCPRTRTWSMVAGATRPLLDVEIAALERYLARGGAVLALVDPAGPHRVGGPARALGRDGGRRRRRGPHPRAVRARDDAASPSSYSESASDHPGAAGAGAVPRGPQHPQRRRLRGARVHGRRELGRDPTSRAWTARARSRSTARIAAGPIPVGAAGTPTLGVELAEDGAEPRLIVFGDTDFAANEYRRHLPQPRPVPELGQLADRRRRGDRGAAEPLPRQPLPAERRPVYRTIRSLSLFVLPELIAVLGVFTWWRRNAIRASR